jgi:xylulokinase
MAAVRASAGVGADVLWCGGGGFRSTVWAQIRADVMGAPLRVMKAEPGVTGAALIAAVAAGDHATLAGAWAATARFGPAIEPDPRMSAFYDGLFAVYTEAISTADAVTRRLAAL